MAKSNPEFQLQQYEFTAHLRDPDSHPAPANIEDRRLEIYRGLLFRNIQNFLTGAFPVLNQLYSKDDWQSLARMFFSQHKSHSPYFRDIAREFLNYLTNEHEPRSCDPSFLIELAHYEWTEIHFTFADVNLETIVVNPDGNLMDEVPIMSPLAQMFSYQYPVHKISPAFQPEHPNEQPVFLTVYRDRQDAVGFMEMNPVSARLMELLTNNSSQTGMQLLEQISSELPHISKDVLIQGGHQALKQLLSKDIILGTES